MKISVVCNEMSAQPLGRAGLFVQALKNSYDVELVGVLGKDELWAPWSGLDCPIKSFRLTEKTRRFPGYRRALEFLINNLDGDVILAVKTRFGSVFPALIGKYFKKIPVIVDVDDWESSLYTSCRWRDQSKSELVLDPESLLYTRIAEYMAGKADALTVVSSFLLEKFGRGVLVRHCRDTERFDPGRFDRIGIRKELGWDGKFVALYLGTPTRRSFSVETVVEAAMDISDRNFTIALVGARPDCSVLRELSKHGDDRIYRQPHVKFEDAPRYIAAADMVLLPCPDNPTMRANVPAKLFDAMAMAKPILASDVSDLKDILAGCGYIYEPGNARDLSDKIRDIMADRPLADEKGRAARRKCIEEYSMEKMTTTLVDTIERLPRTRKTGAR